MARYDTSSAINQRVPSFRVSILIRRFDQDDIREINSFNARLAAEGIADRIHPERPRMASESTGDPLTQELYLAVEGDQVRGGVWLHEHEFVCKGRVIRAGWFKYPVSESLINKTYGGVPGAMLFWLMRRQPNLMALGMGGRGGPLARLLDRVGWFTRSIPFYIAPVRAGRILTTLPRLRRRRVLAALAGLTAHSGLASAVGASVNLGRSIRTSVVDRNVTVTPVSQFGGWTDEIWMGQRDKYDFIARRDTAMLNRLYPPDFPGLTRLRITKAGRDIGWSCTTLSGANSELSANEFGSLRVGMLVDALSDPRDAASVLGLSTRHLIRAGAELIVTNQVHSAWRSAVRSLGFLRAPSNFLFAYSRPLATLCADGPMKRTLFLNRGDCDGPPRW